MAGFMPVGHFLVQNGSKTWRDEVTKLTDGRVQFDYFPAQQLGKASQMLDLVQSGVADIGEVAPAYSTSKLPLYGALEVLGWSKVLAAAQERSASYPSLAELFMRAI